MPPTRCAPRPLPIARLRLPTLLVLAILVVTGAVAQEPDWPLTVVEASNYERTSTLAETIDFLQALQKRGAPLRLETIGHSTEGRPIVLVVCADPPVTSVAAAHYSGRPVVYVQANIHAGEVEGKDAVQILLREIAQQPEHPLRQLVLVATPVYNTDGNEAFGPCELHRPHQDGPALVGKRANGMGLDLNRDCMKAESPEMRAALEHVYRRWNPDVILDLHTTNGTRHGYDLTYSPPLSPNTHREILNYTRDHLLPTVRKKMTQQGFATFDYGNVDDPAQPTRWSTFSATPRFVSNYAGVRGRIGILSEATSYLPFSRRVAVTLAFVRTVLLEITAQRGSILTMTAEVDAEATRWGLAPTTAEPLGTAFELATRGSEKVPLEPFAQRPQSTSAAPTALADYEIEIYDRFRATATARLPRAYAISSAYPEAVELLLRHGIVVERLDAPWTGSMAQLRMAEVKRAKRQFQGHAMVTVSGEFESRTDTLPAGTFIIRTAQPLARLAFHLLEPTSRDGLTAWNFLDRGLREKRLHPVLKIDQQLHASTHVVQP
ncbi:MAG: M14 family metallopeptidase [Planctomycetota bacterium]